jgi:hypothetical protein
MGGLKLGHSTFRGGHLHSDHGIRGEMPELCCAKASRPVAIHKEACGWCKNPTGLFLLFGFFW